MVFCKHLSQRSRCSKLCLAQHKCFGLVHVIQLQTIGRCMDQQVPKGAMSVCTWHSCINCCQLSGLAYLGVLVHSTHGCLTCTARQSRLPIKASHRLDCQSDIGHSLMSWDVHNTHMRVPDSVYGMCSKASGSVLQDIKTKLLSQGKPSQQQIVIISYDLVQKMQDYVNQ